MTKPFARPSNSFARTFATSLALSGSLLGCASTSPEPAQVMRVAGAVARSHLDQPTLLPPPKMTESHPETHQIILLAMDGVRWQEIFEGVDPALVKEHNLPESTVVSARALLPNLHAAIDRGVALGAPGHGAPIVASGPNFASLPGYLEMLSGHPSETCERNDCPPTKQPTLLDECRAMRDVKDTDVAMISSWENLERAATIDPDSMVISAGRHHGKTRDKTRVNGEASRLLDAGAKAFPSPGQDDYRPDRLTAPLALSYLEAERPRCMFIGLGDPDEHAHLSDYRSYLQSLVFIDHTLGELFDKLDSMGEYGQTTSVWITADHGRAEDFTHHGRKSPESARVWLVAAGGAIPKLGFVDAKDTRRLSDVAPSLRVLLGLKTDDTSNAGHPLWEALPHDGEGSPMRSAALSQ